MSVVRSLLYHKGKDETKATAYSDYVLGVVSGVAALAFVIILRNWAAREKLDPKGEKFQMLVLSFFCAFMGIGSFFGGILHDRFPDDSLMQYAILSRLIAVFIHMAGTVSLTMIERFADGYLDQQKTKMLRGGIAAYGALFGLLAVGTGSLVVAGVSFLFAQGAVLLTSIRWVFLVKNHSTELMIPFSAGMNCAATLFQAAFTIPCSQEDAANQGCPFPDDYNHNFWFHLMLLISIVVLSTRSAAVFEEVSKEMFWNFISGIAVLYIAGFFAVFLRHSLWSSELSSAGVGGLWGVWIGISIGISFGAVVMYTVLALLMRTSGFDKYEYAVNPHPCKKGKLAIGTVTWVRSWALMFGLLLFVALLTSVMWTHGNPFMACKALEFQCAESSWVPKRQTKVYNGQIIAVSSVEDVQLEVRNAYENGHTIRGVGSGHSSSAILQGDIGLDLSALNTVHAINKTGMWVDTDAGIPVKRLNWALYQEDLVLRGFGIVQEQSIAGAMGTGTTGADYKTISAYAMAFTFVNATGDLVTVDYNNPADREIVRAMRLSLGSLGIIVRMRIQVFPNVRVLKKTTEMPLPDVNLDFLSALPAKDLINQKLVMQYRDNKAYYLHMENSTESHEVTEDFADVDTAVAAFYYTALPFLAVTGLDAGENYFAGEYFETTVDTEGKVYAFTDALQAQLWLIGYLQYEWYVPLTEAPAIIAFIAEQAQEDVEIAPTSGTITVFNRHNDTLLDMTQLDTPGLICRITLSFNRLRDSLRYKAFILTLEEKVLTAGGVVHWGQESYGQVARLKTNFAHFDRFLAVREQLDPEGVFLSPYLRTVFGIGGADPLMNGTYLGIDQEYQNNKYSLRVVAWAAFFQSFGILPLHNMYLARLPQYYLPVLVTILVLQCIGAAFAVGNPKRGAVFFALIYPAMGGLAYALDRGTHAKRDDGDDSDRGDAEAPAPTSPRKGKEEASPAGEGEELVYLENTPPAQSNPPPAAQHSAPPPPAQSTPPPAAQHSAPPPPAQSTPPPAVQHSAPPPPAQSTPPPAAQHSAPPPAQHNPP